MTLVDATFADILKAAKYYLVAAGLATDANCSLTSSPTDSPPQTPAASDRLWVVSPSTNWVRDLGVVSEGNEVIITGELVVTAWFRTQEVEQVGSDATLLTDPLLGADAPVQKLLSLFDHDSDAAYLLDPDAGTSPLLETLALNSLVMPRRRPGLPWRGYRASFHCRFRLKLP